MSPFVAWFRRCGTALLVCCAVVSSSVGCRTTNNSSNTGGVASSKPKSDGVFGSDPKKAQSPGDFAAPHP